MQLLVLNMARGNQKRTTSTQLALLFISALLLATTAIITVNSETVANDGSDNVVDSIRGVARLDQVRYQTGIDCIIDGRLTSVSVGRINDDFCDCDGGMDEPGTSACSHLSDSFFHCENDGLFPKKIHTSRVNDGVCDCCDGADEFVSGVCSNTCSVDAVSFRKAAEDRLAEVEAGFQQRKALIEGEVAKYLTDSIQEDATTAKLLESLAVLKERVLMHKAREELHEMKMRVELARKKQAEGEKVAAHEKKACAENEAENCDDGADQIVDQATDGVEFEELEAVDMADESLDEESDEKNQGISLEEEEGESQRVKTEINLPDGTRISLAEYLRMDHTLTVRKWKRSRSVDEMRREDFLGPLFNGGEEGRKKIGLYALRSLGLLLSPLRAVAELILIVPNAIWKVLSTKELLGLYIKKMPTITSVIYSPSFRRLGSGSIYRTYTLVVWGCKVVWDAPVYTYNYLFPQLDEGVKSPIAESLREVMKEIEADMKKLEKSREDRKDAMGMDYGPDQVYFTWKDKCFEKNIEKYKYKFCPFNEIKQGYIRMGKWESWGTIEAASPSDGGHQDYTKMHFVKGQKCWNGPDRSVRVELECGAEDEITSVEEPSTCVYEMTVRTPLACTAELLEQAQRDVAFWTKSNTQLRSE